MRNWITRDVGARHSPRTCSRMVPVSGSCLLIELFERMTSAHASGSLPCSPIESPSIYHSRLFNREFFPRKTRPRVSFAVSLAERNWSCAIARFSLAHVCVSFAGLRLQYYASPVESRQESRKKDFPRFVRSLFFLYAHAHFQIFPRRSRGEQKYVPITERRTSVLRGGSSLSVSRFVGYESRINAMGMKFRESLRFLKRRYGVWYFMALGVHTPCADHRLMRPPVGEGAADADAFRGAVKCRNRCYTCCHVTSRCGILTWWHIIRIPRYCCHLVRHNVHVLLVPLLCGAT